MEPAQFDQLLDDIPVGFGAVMEQNNGRDEL